MLLVVGIPARLPNLWSVKGVAALVVRLVFWLPSGVTKMILMMLLLSILLHKWHYLVSLALALFTPFVLFTTFTEEFLVSFLKSAFFHLFCCSLLAQ